MVNTNSSLGRHLTATIAICALSAPAAHAQVRGLPLFFDPTYSYETRFGIDAGNGGDLGGFVWALSGSRLFYVGNCAKLAVSAAGGLWHPSGDQSDAFNGGQVRRTWSIPVPVPCHRPTPLSEPSSVAGGPASMAAPCSTSRSEGRSGT